MSVFLPPLDGSLRPMTSCSWHQMLEEDAIRFDTFLKENDKKAHEAIKKAERETKVTGDLPRSLVRCSVEIIEIFVILDDQYPGFAPQGFEVV